MRLKKRWIALIVPVALGLSGPAWSQQTLPRLTTFGAPVVDSSGPALSAPVSQEKPPPAALPQPQKTNEPAKSEAYDSSGGILHGELGCCADRCKGWGPTMPENLKTFAPFWTDCTGRGINVYGWADLGYTYSSTGGGILAVQPRENRFGNEFLVNQLALVFEKKLKSGEFNTGFKSTLYAGADPALIAPRGGFDTSNPRFGVDFRELFVSAHLPIITEGGMDVRVGRMGTVIGYESALAPYRPFYSADYQWFYAQDGAFTGALTNLHVNKQLDILNGITMGANTFFTYRDHGPCYIGQINYWTTEEKKTLLSTSVYLGPQAIFSAPGRAGDNDYMFEIRIQHDWNACLTQIIQSDNVFASGVPGIGTSEFYSLYSIWSYHATKQTDINFRAEWIRDVQGTRIGTAGNFAEVTLGFDYHPRTNWRIRPEVRGDFADRPAFNGGNRSQLTIGIDALYSF